jgi:hypothetical protein
MIQHSNQSNSTFKLIRKLKMFNEAKKLQAFTQKLETAKVTKVNQGRPLEVFDGKQFLKVTQLSHALPYLNLHEQVIFTKVNQEIILLYKIHDVNEHQPKYLPRQDKDGIYIETKANKIHLSEQGDIEIGSKNCQMLIDKNNHLLLKGKNISLDAEESIKINTPQCVIETD